MPHIQRIDIAVLRDAIEYGKREHAERYARDHAAGSRAFIAYFSGRIADAHPQLAADLFALLNEPLKP